MNGDRLAKRHCNMFYDCMMDFCTDMIQLFPEAAPLRDWKLWYENVVSDDEEKRRRGVEKWVESMESDLCKTKYSRAVASVLGTQAKVFHGLAYKDMAAAQRSTKYFTELELETKLADKRMSKESKVAFWKYIEEMNRHAYACLERTVPMVPTSEEITNDIAARKEQSRVGTPTAAPLKKSLQEVWDKLCELRGVEKKEEDGLCARLNTFGDTTIEGGATMSDACKEKNKLFIPAFNKAFFAARDGADSTAARVWGDDEWDLIDKAFSLSVMETSIPTDMMKGIETVANKLVNDINQGRASLDTLNVETIGQQVLAGVSEEEVASFASNLDKILPALQRMQ